LILPQHKVELNSTKRNLIMQVQFN